MTGTAVSIATGLPRVERYRVASLLLGVGGAATAMTAGVLLPLPGAVVVAALVAAVLVRGPTGRVAAGAGCTAAAAAALLLVGRIDQHDRPPAIVVAFLLVVLGVVGIRATTAQEADAACVAGIGLVVVGASAAVGRGTVIPLVADVLLLVVALWARQRASRTHEPARSAGHPPWRVLGACLGVAALALLAAPAPSSTGLHNTLFHHHGDAANTSSTGTVSPDAFGDSTLDLGIRGQLSDAPVMAVTAAAPDLWRGAVYQSYDGKAWHKPETPVGQQDPAAATVVGSHVSAVALAPSTTDPRPPGTPRRVEVIPVPGTTPTELYAPGVVVSVTSPARIHLGAAGSAQVQTVDGQTAAYVEDVLLPVTGEASLDRATGPDPAGWTDLPAELPRRVRALAAQITADATTRPAKVAAVETYLREHERYTLDAPVPPAGEDAVDDFLFRSHEGFCEQFASAETVLLRSVGVPARLVTGFGYGAVDGDGLRQFTQADAHAWVEVSYGSLGWSTSDPTAGSQLAGARQGLGARIAAFVRSLGHSPARRAAVAGVLAVLVLVAAGATRVVRRRQAGFRIAARRGPVATAFARLERRWPRPPSSTPREYAATLPGDLEAAVAAWESELYSPAGPSRAETSAAVGQIDALRRSR